MYVKNVKYLFNDAFSRESNFVPESISFYVRIFNFLMWYDYSTAF